MITEPMLLPSDVELVPVDELSDDIRAQFEHRPGDHALTRPRSRMPSTIVDENTARLLGSFRTPTRIVDAIIAFASAEHVDPRQALERSYPILKDLLGNGVLVLADSELAEPIGPSMDTGVTVGRFDVVRPVHLMIDTELYLAREAESGRLAAIKIARAGSEQRMRVQLEHEWEILTGLDGTVTPTALELGDDAGRPFLALTWHAGVDAETAAKELRELEHEDGRAGLLGLGRSILAAYARLHHQDVLHGDVHPSNVVAAGDGSVTLIDFGLATRAGDPTIPRGGVDFFMDPETARAQRQHSAATKPQTPAGEQYSVAALLYFLLTGAHTHDFSLEPEEMGRQLVQEPLVSFARRDVHDLDHVESVLARALAKDPTARFGDMDAFLAAWEAASAADLAAGRTSSPPRQSSLATQLLDDTLGRLEIGGPLFGSGLVAPIASVNLGAAGLAYGLLRIAMARDDEHLLALADVWSTRARASLDTDEAFTNRELEITPEDFGSAGIHHSATGVHATAALIAMARGDDIDRSIAVAGFVASGGDPGDQRDVSFGTAGILLGAANLLEAAPIQTREREAVRQLGDRLAAQAWLELSAPGAIGGAGQDAHVRHLGAAHGWGGMLFAQLRWAQATGAPPPAGIDGRLLELGDLAQPFRRGLVWPREVGAPDDGALSSSWCNGAAGLVSLWTLAAATFPDQGFDRLGEGAAWTAYDGPTAPGDFCCGLAGRAYGVLSLYRITGERIWLARAVDLAERSARAVRENALRRDSLYKGEIGVAVLAADLERPSESALPFYDREPWPSTGVTTVAVTDLPASG